MPIYEYACKQCGHELDALQKMSDDPLRECPSCGEASLKRKISAPRFRLKGSGWYETDFKTGNKEKPAAKTEKGGAAASGASKGSDGGKAA